MTELGKFTLVVHLSIENYTTRALVIVGMGLGNCVKLLIKLLFYTWVMADSSSYFYYFNGCWMWLVFLGVHCCYWRDGSWFLVHILWGTKLNDDIDWCVCYVLTTIPSFIWFAFKTPLPLMAHWVITLYGAIWVYIYNMARKQKDWPCGWWPRQLIRFSG